MKFLDLHRQPLTDAFKKLGLTQDVFNCSTLLWFRSSSRNYIDHLNDIRTTNHH